MSFASLVSISHHGADASRPRLCPDTTAHARSRTNTGIISNRAVAPHTSIPGAQLYGVVHSDDGETAVVVGWRSGDGFVGVINWATGAVLAEVPGLERPASCVTRLALAQGGCFVVGFIDGSLRVFRQDAASKALVAAAGPSLPRRHTNTVRSVAVSSTGRVLASASYDGTVCLWDVDAATGAITASALGGGGTLGHPDWVCSLAWSPTDEHLLATACYDGHVRLFDVRAGAEAVAEMAKVGGAYNYAYCLAFDPSDGATIAAVYGLGQVARWDARAPHAAVGAPTQAHDGQVVCLQYSPCGTVLATGGVDKMVRLWDATGPELVALADDPVLQGHTDWVTRLDFNPSDPSSLLSCSWDGTVRRWDLPECALGLPFEGPSPPDSPPRPAAAAATAVTVAATGGDEASSTSGLGKRAREADADDDDGGAAGGSGGGSDAARERW